MDFARRERDGGVKHCTLLRRVARGLWVQAAEFAGWVASDDFSDFPGFRCRISTIRVDTTGEPVILDRRRGGDMDCQKR